MDFLKFFKMYLLVATLVVLCPIGTCLNCPKPKGNNCLPIGRTPASCITQVEDGTSLTWFDMQDNCGKNEGRLVWLKDDVTASSLAATESSLTGASFTTIDLLVIGLLHSMKRDYLNFWRNPYDNDTLSCGTEDTGLCLQSPATEKQCNMIGCCWLHEKCQYPEHQILPLKNDSDFINTKLISESSERSCVGLQRSGKKWTFTGYNCTQTSAANTGYVCEYKCQKDWPKTPSKNVSWPRNDSAKISSTPSYTHLSQTSITKRTNISTNLTKPYTAKPNANTRQTDDNFNATLHGTTTTEIVTRINQTVSTNLTKPYTAKPNANTRQTDDNYNATLHGTTTTEIVTRINQTVSTNLTKPYTAKPNANTRQTDDNSNATLHGTTTTEIVPSISQTDAPSNSSDESGNGASNTICLEAVCTITLALLIIEVQRWI